MKIISALSALLALVLAQAQGNTVATPQDTAEKALLGKVLVAIEAQNEIARQQTEKMLKVLIAAERALQDAVANPTKQHICL